MRIKWTLFKARLNIRTMELRYRLINSYTRTVFRLGTFLSEQSNHLRTSAGLPPLVSLATTTTRRTNRFSRSRSR